MTKKDDPKFEGTRVDLGEDLLNADEQPSASPVPKISENNHSETTGKTDILDAWLATQPVDSQSQYESAKILINEGLLEQAKKLLHRILIREPTFVLAQEALHHIHEEELKQIFDDHRARNRYRRGGAPAPEDDVTSADADAVLRKLDLDLGLGLEQDAKNNPLRDFLRTPDQLKNFLGELEHAYRDATVQDRLDIGIGFLEMELFDVAIAQFQAAHKKAGQSGKSSALLTTACLLSTALLLSGKPFDAVMVLQPIVGDQDIPREDKIELFYLMGRSNQALQKLETALYWYEQVEKIDMNYRDLQDLKRRLRKT